MGGQLSIANNDLNSTISQSINDSLSESVTGESNTSLGNIQSVQQSSNCLIDFATQNATALAVQNLTSNLSGSDSIQQTLVQQITENAQALNTGVELQLATISDASNTANLYNQMAISVAKTFNTTCSSNASGFNTQSVSGCSDSTINFATQNVSLQNISNCVANITSQTNISQQLQQIVDLAASATNSGIDIMQILGIAVVIVIVMTVGGTMAKNKGKEDRYDENDIKGCRQLSSAGGGGGRCDAKPKLSLRSKNSTRAIVFIVLVTITLITWISLMVSLNYWPVPFKPRSAACTTPAQNFPGTVTYSSISSSGLTDTHSPVNYYAYYNASCSGVSGNAYYSTCTGQPVSYGGSAYLNCGLWGGACDDAQFIKQDAKWQAVQLACASFGLAYGNSKLTSCDPAVLLDAILLATQDCPGGGNACFIYSGCHQCTTGPNSGFFVQDKTVPTDDDNCTKTIDHTKYFVDNATAGICPPHWLGPTDVTPPTCVADPANLSTGDCPNSGYQSRMLLYLQLQYNCNSVLAASPDTTITDPNTVCMLPVTAFLTKADGTAACDPTTHLCDYVGTSSATTLACKNDFSTCEDPKYLGDLNVAQNWNSICTSTYSSYYHEGTPVGSVMLVATFLFVIGIIASYFGIPKDLENEAKKNADTYNKTIPMPADLRAKPNPAGG